MSPPTMGPGPGALAWSPPPSGPPAPLRPQGKGLTQQVDPEDLPAARLASGEHEGEGGIVGVVHQHLLRVCSGHWRGAQPQCRVPAASRPLHASLPISHCLTPTVVHREFPRLSRWNQHVRPGDTALAPGRGADGQRWAEEEGSGTWLGCRPPEAPRGAPEEDSAFGSEGPSWGAMRRAQQARGLATLPREGVSTLCPFRLPQVPPRGARCEPCLSAWPTPSQPRRSLPGDHSSAAWTVQWLCGDGDVPSGRAGWPRLGTAARTPSQQPWTLLSQAGAETLRGEARGRVPVLGLDPSPEALRPQGRPS